MFVCRVCRVCPATNGAGWDRDSNETVLNTFLLPQEDAEGGSGGSGKRHRDHKLTMLINETRDVLERC